MKLIYPYVIFPFNKKYNPSLTSQYFIYNDLYINFSIGNPKQEIKGILDNNLRGLYIPNIIVNGNYNENKSNTYIYDYISDSTKIQRKLIYNGYTFLTKSSKETLFFNQGKGKEEIPYNNFSFLLLTSNTTNAKLETAIIGLLASSNKDTFNTFFQLKEKNIISFIYNNENSGEIIIGDYPHEYYNNLDTSSLKLFKAKSFLGEWIMEFSNVKYGNKNDSNKNAVFKNDIKGIISNRYYHEYVNNTFFGDLFIQKKCFYETIKNKNIKLSELTIYYCDKDINIKQFESLEFISKEMNFSFVFDYNDLFQVYNNKYVFLVFFDSLYEENWKLGEIFMSKYKVFLDMDSHLFGFYTINKIKNHTVYYILIIILLIIIVFILVFLLYKGIIGNKTRKIRANELEEEYDYITSLND